MSRNANQHGVKCEPDFLNLLRSTERIYLPQCGHCPLRTFMTQLTHSHSRVTLPKNSMTHSDAPFIATSSNTSPKPPLANYEKVLDINSIGQVTVLCKKGIRHPEWHLAVALPMPAESSP